MIKRFIISVLNDICINLIRKTIDFETSEPKKVLVIAPHPDDETLGVGGMLLKLLDSGYELSIVFLTDGEGSGVWHDREEIKKQRILLSDRVCEKLKVKIVYRLHLGDGALPSLGDKGADKIIFMLQELIDSICPDHVFTTHPSDYWPYDHCNAAYMVSEAIQKAVHKPALWFFWVWTWYNMRPWSMRRYNYKSLYKIRINKELPRKAELIKLYLNTLTPTGKPWSGILPEQLVKAFYRPIEVLEKIS